MHAKGLARGLVVLDRHLRLRVGTQVGHYLALATNVGQLLEDHMREDQRGRHQLAGLVAGITEHDTLVTGTLLLLLLAGYALVDVGRLLVDGRENATRVAVELVLALRVADLLNHATRYALHIDIGLRAHLTGHHDQTRGAEGLTSHLRGGIVAQKFVKNSIGNLIRNLIGMSFRNGLRGKQKTHIYVVLIINGINGKDKAE